MAFTGVTNAHWPSPSQQQAGIHHAVWQLQQDITWPVVVALVVERSLPIPEVRGSNPVIDKNLFMLNISLLSTVYWKDENKEK